MDEFYRFACDKSHHFTKTVYNDCFKLLDRFHYFYSKQKTLPTDEETIQYFHWSKDHLHRCYQMLKEMNIVSYARNHRRTTLRFHGKFACLNDYLPKKED